MSGWGLYVHVPFCPQKCPYCAFAVVVGQEKLHRPYARAVCRELQLSRGLGPQRPFDTVYFGGGTPSLLEPSLLAAILAAADVQGIAAAAEITVEANPDRADVARFAALKGLGCNRISIGVQSFGAAGLQALGRIHRAADSTAALLAARQAGFDNIGVDLIFGVPGVAPAEWEDNLQRVVALRPEHVSAYGLTLEEDTRFFQLHRKGEWTPEDEEIEAGHFERADEVLRQAGYEHYEVSNYALPGYRSRHNAAYWSGGQYLGVGQAAHSHIGGRRWWNIDRLKPYIAALEQGQRPVAGGEEIDVTTRRCERLWLGLRTADGALLEGEEALQLRAAPRFEQLVKAGMWQMQGQRLCLTRQGMALADALGIEATGILEAGPAAGLSMGPASEAAIHHSKGTL